MEPTGTCNMKRKLPTWMAGRAKSSKEDNLQGKTEPKKSMLNLPLLEFNGKVIYSYNKDDCALICCDVRNELKDTEGIVVGFDMEWPVTYEAGKEPKTALIQICMPDLKCYLLQVSCMPDLPKPLKELLLDHRLQKTGVGIESDMWKLGRDFDIDPLPMIRNSMINLTKLANEVLGFKENWSLDSLCRHVLMKSLDKDVTVRRSDWRAYPLSDGQIKYAALDAYAGLLLYEELMNRKKKQTSSS